MVWWKLWVITTTNFLTEIGLDKTSVVGADEWGKQMEEMLKEMTAQLKALGYTK